MIQIEDKVEAKAQLVKSELEVLDETDQEEDDFDGCTEAVRTKPRVVPPIGTGQKIYEIDPMLAAHRAHLDYR